MKKEDFFEVLGELDDNIVKGAKTHMKKKNSWKIWGSIAACFALVAVLGIGMRHSNTPDVINKKPVINFEGVVVAVDENSVTLKDGKIVLITESTEFMSDPDTGNAISEDIKVGNFIQGYTKDDTSAAEITASKIWTNEGRSFIGDKRVINFEGRVANIEQGSVILDNGKVVNIAENTTITSPDGDSAEIAEGDYIQGYAENAENSEITAKYILITVL